MYPSFMLNNKINQIKKRKHFVGLGLRKKYEKNLEKNLCKENSPEIYLIYLNFIYFHVCMIDYSILKLTEAGTTSTFQDTLVRQTELSNLSNTVSCFFLQAAFKSKAFNPMTSILSRPSILFPILSTDSLDCHPTSNSMIISTNLSFPSGGVGWSVLSHINNQSRVSLRLYVFKRMG